HSRGGPTGAARPRRRPVHGRAGRQGRAQPHPSAEKPAGTPGDPGPPLGAERGRMTTNETLDVPTDLPTTIQLEPATPPDEFTAPAQPAGGAEGPAAPQAERTVEIR